MASRGAMLESDTVKGSHKLEERLDVGSGGRTDWVGLAKCIEPSSNGKTPDFGSGNRGSNPRGSTNNFP